MNTNFETIVRINEIGGTNSVKSNELLALAKQENIARSADDKEKVLFIGIDFQNDFMENGELGVPNSHRDIENTTRFLYRNLAKITDIAVSLDTHGLHQIFHPCWWVDNEGNHPQPFTIITADDVKNGKWKAVEWQRQSLNYVENLERLGKKQLCIWTYHCIEGTFGASLEGQFSNMIHYHSIARNSPIQKIAKGKDPLSEMYGFIKPEYSGTKEKNIGFLLSLKYYDKIFIAGEAKSHCVLESIRQIVEHHYEIGRNPAKRIYVLEDCMSPITGFEEATEQAFEELTNKYGINRVVSNDITL